MAVAVLLTPGLRSVFCGVVTCSVVGERVDAKSLCVGCDVVVFVFVVVVVVVVVASDLESSIKDKMHHHGIIVLTRSLYYSLLYNVRHTL